MCRQPAAGTRATRKSALDAGPMILGESIDPVDPARTEAHFNEPSLIADHIYDDPRDAYFDTLEITRDLKRRTVRGGVVTLSSQAVKFVLRMGSTAVLARLLTPADFGLIAMVTVVTGFVEMFKDAGLSMATVQRQKITHAQVSTLFWINVGLSVVVMVAIAVLAPAIAWFYDDPRLTTITLALAGTTIFGGLAVQHQALLRRRMEFGKLAVIEITAMGAGVVTAVTLAWQGASYWALVGMTAGAAVTTAAMSHIMSGWVPGLASRRCGMGPLLKSGLPLAGSNFINYWSNSIDKLVIAKLAGASIAGLYGRSNALLLVPFSQFCTPVTAVAIPALCRVHKTRSRLKMVYGKSCTLLLGSAVILVALAVIYPSEIVILVLGDAWIDAVPFLVALTPAVLASAIGTCAGWLYIATGKTGLQLKVNVVQNVAMLSLVAIAAYHGPLAVAWSYSLTRLVGASASLSLIIFNTFASRNE